MGTKHFWSPQNNCFVPPNSVLVVALVAKGGVESVVESMVSVMEVHSSSLRGLTDQQRIEHGMMVAWNGENIYHCDSVVNEALDSYLSKCKREGDKDGHFIRRSSNIKSFVVSKLLIQMLSALQSCLSRAMTSDPEHVR